VSTLIQRSTATNARKLQALLEVSPPSSRRVHGVTRNRLINPRRIAKSEEARKVITELFGRSLSDLSEDEHASNTSSGQKGESDNGIIIPATTELQHGK